MGFHGLPSPWEKGPLLLQLTVPHMGGESQQQHRDQAKSERWQGTGHICSRKQFMSGGLRWGAHLGGESVYLLLEGSVSKL